jgi:hypothetical protein
VIAVFVVYLGIALRAVLRAETRTSRRSRYQVFSDLLDWPDCSTGDYNDD